MTADEIISREIGEAVASLRTSAHQKRTRADDLLRQAAEYASQADRIEDCDKRGRHKFVAVKGSGMLGDRFEERCTNCGWVHTS